MGDSSPPTVAIWSDAISGRLRRQPRFVEKTLPVGCNNNAAAGPMGALNLCAGGWLRPRESPPPERQARGDPPASGHARRPVAPAPPGGPEWPGGGAHL